MTAIGIHGIGHQGAQERVDLACDTLQVSPPESLLDEDGAPSDACINFVCDNGLSLDWLFRGDVRPLLRASRELLNLRDALEPQVERLNNAIGDNSRWPDDLPTGRGEQ